MRAIILFSILSIFLIRCDAKSKKENTNKKAFALTTTAALQDTAANGVVTIYYPKRKSKKITGKLDKNGKRHETWTFFKEDGSVGSITTYNHGKKHGITLVYHPTGKLHYKGQYAMGNKTGEWKIFDQSGNLQQTINYSQQVK